MSRTKIMSFLGLLIIISMILSACAPQTIVQTVVVKETQIIAGTPVTNEVVVTATPVPPTAPPPTAAPQSSDTAVLVLQQEPDTMHPLIGSMMAKTIVLGAVIVGCMGQNEKAEWLPFGCESIPTVDNGGAKFVGDGADKHLEVTYKIRKDWRWTDGTPVKASDAVYYWKLYMDPAMELADRTFMEKIYSFKAVDDQTVLVTWMSEKQAKEAAAGTLTGDIDFKNYVEDYKANAYDTFTGPVTDPLYFTGIGWYPEHVWGKIAAKDQASAPETSKTPMGDGPYVVKEWKQGQEIDLTAADKPFPLGEPKIKNIIFRFIADTPAVIAALQNGEVDAVTTVGGLTVNNAPDLDKIDAAGAYKTLYQQGYAWEHIDLNTTKFPLDDVKVRQALYYAIDKNALVDKLYFGKQKPTDLPVPPFSWAFTEDYTKYPFSVDKAKALLADAGWDCKALPCVNKDGKKLEITLMTTDRADRQALAQVIQSMWKAINVGVNIQFLYGRGLFASGSQGGPLYARTFDAAIYTWVTGDDPSFMGLYNCAAIPTKENGFQGQNNPGYCNKQADKDLQESEINPDNNLSREKRKPFIFDFFKQWTTDVPVIPLFSNTNVSVARVGFKNWTGSVTSSNPDTWNSWMWELSK